MTFHDLIHTVEDAASTAVHVTQALTGVGHIADTPEAKKGTAVLWALKLVNAALAAHGGQAFAPFVDGLVEHAIEAALVEAKELARHLGGLEGVTEALLKAVS